MAAESGDRLGVPKLGVDNYVVWSKKIRFALTVKGLWSAITDPEDPGNDKALAIIGLSLEDYNLPLIEDCDTAADAWDALKELHQSTCIADALRLKQELAGLSMGPGEPVTKYVARAKTLRDNLDAAGYTIDDKDVILAILGGLPKTYDTIVTVLANDKSTSAVNDVMAKLMLVEKRNNINSNTGNGELALFTGIKKARGYVKGNNSNSDDGPRCWHCNENGHIKANCPKRAAVCLAAHVSTIGL